MDSSEPAIAAATRTSESVSSSMAVKVLCRSLAGVIESGKEKSVRRHRDCGAGASARSRFNASLSDYLATRVLYRAIDQLRQARRQRRRKRVQLLQKVNQSRLLCPRI